MVPDLQLTTTLDNSVPGLARTGPGTTKTRAQQRGLPALVSKPGIPAGHHPDYVGGTRHVRRFIDPRWPVYLLSPALCLSSAASWLDARTTNVWTQASMTSMTYRSSSVGGGSGLAPSAIWLLPVLHGGHCGQQLPGVLGELRLVHGQHGLAGIA